MTDTAIDTRAPMRELTGRGDSLTDLAYIVDLAQRCEHSALLAEDIGAHAAQALQAIDAGRPAGELRADLTQIVCIALGQRRALRGAV